MSTRLFFKLVTVVLLTLMLSVPIGLTSWVLQDRVTQRETAKQSVMASTSGEQRLSGVVLVLPYRVRRLVKESVPTKVVVRVPGVEEVSPQTRSANAKGAGTKGARAGKRRGHKGARRKATRPLYETRTVMREVTKEVFDDHQLLQVPDRLDVRGAVTTTTLYRGIYGVPTFVAKLKLKGSVQLAVGALAKDSNVTFGEPYLPVGIGDVRGLRQTPALTWDQGEYAVKPGTKLALLGEGVHVPLPDLHPKQGGAHTFALPLQLAGATDLGVAPIGRSTTVALTADWPHPSFHGRFLPSTRAIDASGFRANWQMTSLATDLGAEVQRLAKQGGVLSPRHDIGVAFVEPVDAYSQIGRALKYALLFVLLTFSAFFLFEIIKRLRIHPMQYALVGCAQAIFYLLVVALSEHMAFATAYGIASAACVGLITFYVSHVLRSWWRAVGFGAGLAALYGALFGILRSEDQALLLGALLVFGALAAVMGLTRKLDWYGVGRGVGQATAPGAGPGVEQAS